MVVKILEPASTAGYSVEYNEEKCSRKEASLLHLNNIDKDEGVGPTLDRYERGSLRATEMGFHMSVNPGRGEFLTDEEAVSFISEMMERLGYGSQPYAVYRHNDIDRMHYHVISVRVNAEGRKIPDFQENRRCLEILNHLAPLYDLRVGNGDGQRFAVLGIDPRRFNPNSGNVMEQIRIIAAECCKYHFTSLAQFKLIMRAHGLELQERGRSPLEFVVRGLDQSGSPSTAPYSEKDVSIKIGAEFSRRLDECTGASSVKKRERGRISGISFACLEHSTSERHFKNMLARFDILLHLHRTKEGRIYGATFVDHSTKCAFKCSELDAFKLESLIAADEGGQWQKGGHAGAHEDSSADLNLVGTAVAAVGKGNSKSQEKDMKDNPKKRKMKR